MVKSIFPLRRAARPRCVCRCQSNARWQKLLPSDGGKPQGHGASIFFAGLLFVVTGCGSSGDPVRDFEAGNYRDSFKAFTRLAASGDTDAFNFLGIHYYLGAGVDKDFERAAQWFERGALARNASAQRNLGMLYLRGWGVPRNNVHAYGWLHQSYSQGNQVALHYLRMTSNLITPNQTMEARAWVADILGNAGDPR